jgi:hypothetical protein
MMRFYNMSMIYPLVAKCKNRNEIMQVAIPEPIFKYSGSYGLKPPQVKYIPIPTPIEIRI